MRRFADKTGLSAVVCSTQGPNTPREDTEMAIRSHDTDMRAAFDEASTYARQIANHVVAGVDVPDDLLDEYARARGVVDRLVDAAVGDAQHASYYGEHMHAGPRADCKVCPILPPAVLDESRYGEALA